MGKQVSTLKMTGSFAGAVGYIDQQGRVQMRSKAEAFHDANTTKQKIVRTRFLAVTSLAKAFKKSALGLSVVAKRDKISWSNKFVKTNYGATDATASQATGSVAAETDFSLLKVSMGDNPEVSFGSLNTSEPLTVEVTFGTNSDMPGASEDDLVYLLIYNPADNRTLLSSPVRRAEGKVSATVPNGWNGEEVHVWGFSQGFANEQARTEYLSWFNQQRNAGFADAITNVDANTTDFSNSHYLGTGTIS